MARGRIVGAREGHARASHIMQLSIMLNTILLVGIWPPIEIRIEARPGRGWKNATDLN